MGARTLRDAVDTADAERFVGRETELDVVRDLLGTATPSRLLFVHGPGGIGKSTLLRAAGRLAAGSGYAVVHVDARSLPAVLEHAAAAILQHAGEPRCIVLDEVDALRSTLDALRDRLLDRLPGSARLIVAGRRGPSRSWREAGLDAVVVDLRLRPLSADESGALLASRSVAGDRIAAIVEWAQGSPLALTVAASTPGGHADAPGSAGLEQRLTSWLTGQPILDVPASLLEVAAFARVVDARLLAAVAPGRSGHEGMRMLSSLPVTERLGDVVELHAVLAASIRARVRASEPSRAAELVRSIAEQLATRARLGDMGALLRLSRLLESPALREALANEPSDTCYADQARPGEFEAFGRAHGFDRGADWPELQAWVQRWPEHSLLVRRIDASPVMFASFVRVGVVTASGPIAASLRGAAERTGVDTARSFAGVVLFADVATSDIAEAARLGTGAFMLQHRVADMQSILIHYPVPDRRPALTAAIATEVEGDLQRPVAISDFRPAGAVGTVEAMVLGEQGFVPRAPGPAALLREDDDPERIARLQAALDEVFGPDEQDRRLRRAIELVHLASRRSEQECLDELHVSRRSWYRLLRTARERVAAHR